MIESQSSATLEIRGPQIRTGVDVGKFVASTERLALLQEDVSTQIDIYISTTRRKSDFTRNINVK